MSALLLVGFNRPEFTIKHLKQLVENRGDFEAIYLYVDGPRKNVDSDRQNQEKIREYLLHIESEIVIESHFRTENLGLSKNIKDAISVILVKHEAVVVLEDDVEISISAMVNIKMQIEAVTESGLSNPVIGMSSLTKKRFVSRWIVNEWRSSRYFSAWGFGVNKYFWEQHLKYLAEKSSTAPISTNNYFLGEVSKRKREVWKPRFNSEIYDYEIQETLFARGMTSFAPRFRIVGNIGFGPNSTHTRFPPPRYLYGPIDNNLLTASLRKPNYYTLERKVFNFADSITFAGDSLFSVRGRKRGIRSSLRLVFQAFLKLFRL